MSKLVSVTMIKDEEKIIESFIRYNIHYFDKMIIIDNGCTDKTMDIVWALKEEGYDIEIFNESYVDFELTLMENKYMKIAANEYKADWIIPLDADEFISDISTDVLAGLDSNKIYYVYWKNYIISDYDDENEPFVPKRMTYRLQIKSDQKEHDNVVTKVIIPGDLVRNHHIIMSAGHHEVINYNVDIEILDRIYIAHFPIISYEQMYTKLCGSYNNFIPWRSRATDGIHVNQYKIAMDNNDEKVKLLAKGGWVAGIDKVQYYDVIEDPLNPSLVDTIQLKYTDNIPLDVTKYFVRQAELMGIKLFNAKKGIGLSNCPKILVYGTGKSAENLLDRVNPDCVEILAYIDSDPVKQYTKFHHNMIISPDKIKFYDYDKIVVASVFFDEIKKKLLEFHIDEQDIVDKSYLTELSISERINQY